MYLLRNLIALLQCLAQSQQLPTRHISSITATPNTPTTATSANRKTRNLCQPQKKCCKTCIGWSIGCQAPPSAGKYGLVSEGKQTDQTKMYKSIQVFWSYSQSSADGKPRQNKLILESLLAYLSIILFDVFSGFLSFRGQVNFLLQ